MSPPREVAEEAAEATEEAAELSATRTKRTSPVAAVAAAEEEEVVAVVAVEAEAEVASKIPSEVCFIKNVLPISRLIQLKKPFFCLEFGSFDVS